MLDVIGSIQIDSPQVYKLVYRSKFAIPGGYEEIIEQVGRIMTWSKEWNFRHAITGALLLDGSGFAQVLEGPAFNVKSLFGHIICDDRHKDVELLYHGFHEDRDFSKWTMAFANKLMKDEVEFASTPEQHDAPVSNDGASDVLTMLKGLLLDPA